MTGSNTSLTVSYGAFSCTLEGFDQPFSTMQSVVEYFRELTADSPGFGTVGPIADAPLPERDTDHGGPGIADTDMSLDPHMSAEPDSASGMRDPSEDTVDEDDLRSAEPAGYAEPDISESGETSAIEIAVRRAREARLGHAEPDILVEAGTGVERSNDIGDVSIEDDGSSLSPLSDNMDFTDQDDETAPSDDGDEPDVEIDGHEHVDLDASATSDDTDDLKVDERGDEYGDSDREPDGTAAPADVGQGDDDDAGGSSDDDELTSGIRALMGRPDDEDADRADLVPSEVGNDLSGPSGEADDALSEPISERPAGNADTELADRADDPAPGENGDAVSDKEQGETSLRRLLDETNAKLVDAEGNRRRSAIAHLKAAVAATKADGPKAGQDSTGPSATGRFGNDLAEAVRPRRPSLGQDGNRIAKRPPDPDAERSAPLVLVSSQRVDRPCDETPVRITPTRPMRISSEKRTDDEKPFSGNESFGAFADRIGARDLPDILEAAAAYAKVVEGQDGLTRPAILERAIGATDGDVSREEGLQSFGKLLNSGRIRKLDQGRFGLDDDSDMIERARAALS